MDSIRKLVSSFSSGPVKVAVDHPFPTELILADYVPADFSALVVSVLFTVAAVAVSGGFYAYASTRHKSWKLTDTLIFIWSGLNAVSKLTLSLYYIAFNGSFLASSGLLSSVVKTWSLVDARYIVGDASNYVYQMELWNVLLIAPLYALTALLQHWDHPSYLPTLITTSALHLFASLLYYLTAYHVEFKDVDQDGIEYWLGFVVIGTLVSVAANSAILYVKGTDMVNVLRQSQELDTKEKTE